MKLRLMLTVLLAISLVGARARNRRPASQPATAQATTQASTFPTANELFAKLKKIKKQKADEPKVAYFNLTQPIVEKPADFSFFGENITTPLEDLLDRLHQAKDDKNIKAVLITLGDSGLSLAQAQEVRDALTQISKSGKKTFVYADSFDTASYTLASGATDICMMSGGDMMIPGVGMEATFAKATLDKIGVQADYIQIGEFKGADEELTRTGPSDELRGELNKLMDSLYGQITEGIASHRKLPIEKVKATIDEALLTGEKAKERGLVDHLCAVDDLRELISKEVGEKIDLVHDYGQESREEVDMSNPFAFFSMMMKKPEVSDKPTVAMIYADGVIVDGRGEQGMFGGSGVGSDDIRRAMRMALRDDNVKAIVLRINSPGGSALASEAMWQAVRHTSEKKPVIVSIGSMAASGGYYLASASDTIFADPTAIVGSIGVVGGKFVIKDLYSKIGLSTESFTRGKNADLFTSTHPFTESQRQMVTSWMKQTYEQFTQRVMTTRKGKIQDIDKVARGRIFLASAAKDLGMVDEIGGTEDAIAYAAKKVDLKPGEYDVRTIPGPRSFADLFTGGAGRDAQTPVNPDAMRVAADSVLRAVAPSVRKVIGQQLQMIELLQARPVILTSPVILSIH